MNTTINNKLKNTALRTLNLFHDFNRYIFIKYNKPGNSHARQLAPIVPINSITTAISFSNIQTNNIDSNINIDVGIIRKYTINIINSIGFNTYKKTKKTKHE